MRRLIRTSRPQRLATRSLTRKRRATVARGIPRRLPRVQRQKRDIGHPSIPPDSINYPDPYLDYGRFLTPEGGIRIIYKDIDERLRHTLWRIFAWVLFTGAGGWFLFHEPIIHTRWIKIVLLVTVGIVNWLIVRKPVELYRSVEIRPDCMILDGYDIFWAQFIETGLPSFRPDETGNIIMCGVYGTRQIDYLTIRRFDEADRMPEVMVSHLHAAMTQLWTRPT